MDVLEFLSDMTREGKAYRTVNLYQSMLSPKEIEGHKIGNHPLVVKFFKEVFNSNPPRAKNSQFWDQNIVSDVLESLGKNKILSL